MYSEIKKKIKPFDLIFFKGGEKISSAIRFIQQATLGVNEFKNVWSHVGLVVSRDLFDDPRLEKGKLYLIESTLSGKWNDGVKNIDGEAFFGVQIRDLDLLSKKYISSPKYKGKKKSGIGWARLHDNPFRDMSEEGLRKQQKIREQFTKMYPTRWEGLRYDINFIALASAVWPIFRPLNWFVHKIGKKIDTDDWVFCSELVFDILQVFKFYDGRFDSSLVLPQDLLGFDQTSPGVPKIFDDPIEFTVF